MLKAFSPLDRSVLRGRGLAPGDARRRRGVVPSGAGKEPVPVSPGSFPEPPRRTILKSVLGDWTIRKYNGRAGREFATSLLGL